MLSYTCNFNPHPPSRYIFNHCLNAIRLHYTTVFFYCSSASNRIIHAKDHASIQINIAEVSNPTLGVVVCLIYYFTFQYRVALLFEIRGVFFYPRGHISKL